MAPEAAETISVGLGFTVSASNSQFSHVFTSSWKLKLINFMTVRVVFISHQLKQIDSET